MSQPADQQPCAVVTGGARNIGQAIALRLQQDGYRVVVVDIVEPEAPTLQADAYQVDLADADATRRVMAEIAEHHAVTRLVNNVGIVAPALIEEAQLEDFDKLMHLNVRSALICTQALLPSMKASGMGRIVLNTSRVVLGKEARTIYSATKGHCNPWRAHGRWNLPNTILRLIALRQAPLRPVLSGKTTHPILNAPDASSKIFR
ncbi:hypothetical protein HSBAA_65490 [Vreelandella sulfidaeris]|uniref:Short-chain dehydrogenase n=1 Tax=Vreelandella sulfidaeris TaxID=115553 RepID=A0A455UIK9_9GAMM|nr:hypothetical protein HSBAA_65490 [Halomonas sulfidaeris]